MCPPAKAYDPCGGQESIIALDGGVSSTYISGSLTVTNSQTEYDSLLTSAFGPTSTFQVVLSSVPLDEPPYQVAGDPVVRAWVTVYDQSTIDMWNAIQATPGFLNGVEANGVPAIADAAFDIDIVAPREIDVYQYYHAKLRIQKSDGAYAVVFMQPTNLQKPDHIDCGDIRCDGGPWWKWGKVCCTTQHDICTLVHWLFRSVCGNCDSCYQACIDCSVSNPCHSCGNCGGSQILCRLFGHC